MSNRKIPRRLYKYRAFNSLTLDMLVAGNIFFADPATFNDPLDTKPCLSTDLDTVDLEGILRQMIEQRIHAEMTAAATAIKYRGPKTLNHIENLSQNLTESRIAEIRYYATDPSIETVDPLKVSLGHHIEEELLRRYGSGIVSLAARETCPLMWSHYGDQHKGVCIGYSIPDDTAANLHKVNYGGARFIAASAVAAMPRGDQDAKRRVDEAFLTRKAYDWRYEREWRLIGDRGFQDSPLRLEEIIFGLRCANTVRFTVVSALNSRPGRIKFYEIEEQSGKFLLSRRPLYTDELMASYPRDCRAAMEDFEPISLDDLKN